MNTPEVKRMVEAGGIVTLKADKTQPAPEVDELLVLLGNKGKSIPFYAVFPAGNPNKPIVLDGVFTSPGPILAALKNAGPSKHVGQVAKLQNRWPGEGSGCREDTTSTANR